MGNLLNTAVELGEKGSNYAKYRIRIGVNSNETAYFGLIGGGSYNFLCVVNHDNTALRYIGYPEKSRWDSVITPSTGAEPYAKLVYQQSINPNNSPYGAALGCLISRGSSYVSDWQTVSIDKGNSRKGSRTIYAGIRTYYPNHSTNGEEVIPVTLYTTETSDATFNSDPQVTLTDTTLTISGSFTNPDNYYRVRIYDKDTGAVMYTTEENATSYSWTKTLTEDMYGSTKKYLVKFIGKDDSIYGITKTVSVVIPERAFNIWMKQNQTINKDKRVYFKNVNYKEPRDIWVKKNNQIHKVKR